jgi:diketogulonate reductase-like aldo/keto reductase
MGTTSASDSEIEAQMRPKLDPLRKQVTDFLKNTSQYEDQVKDTLQPYYYRAGERLKGYATEAGTDAYYRKSQYDEPNLEVHPSNFKTPFENMNLKITSIGVGTYMGDPDDYTDFLMYDSIKTSVLSGGVNHIDTAPNYRYKKSESTVGRILTTLDNKYGITRDQLVVSTKGGYIPEDAEKQISRSDEIRRMISELKVPESEIVKESAHCMHPEFLRDQIEGSLARLNLETIDVYYLQNPYEGQGPYNTDNVFFDRLTAAFEFLESQVQAGKIKHYGMATYSCFRVKPNEGKMHLSLEKVMRLAEKVGGSDHHMRYIQVPINVMMPEAFIEPW